MSLMTSILLLTVLVDENRFASLSPLEVVALPSLDRGVSYSQLLGARDAVTLTDDGRTLLFPRFSFHIIDVRTGKLIGTDAVKYVLLDGHRRQVVSRSVSQNAKAPLPAKHIESGVLQVLAGINRDRILGAAEILGARGLRGLTASAIDRTKRGPNPNLDGCIIGGKTERFSGISGLLDSPNSGKIATRTLDVGRNAIRIQIYSLSSSGLIQSGSRKMTLPKSFGTRHTSYDLASDLVVAIGAEEIRTSGGTQRLKTRRLPWLGPKGRLKLPDERVAAWPLQDGVLVSRIVVTNARDAKYELYFLDGKGVWKSIGPYALAARSASGRFWIVGDPAKKVCWLLRF